MSATGPKVSFSGPKGGFSQTGLGFNFKSFSIQGSNMGHQREVSGPNIDFEASLSKNKGRFSFQGNLFDFSHQTPGGHKLSYSKGFGGEVGFEDHPSKKRVNLTLAPFGKGKMGFSTSLSYSSLNRFSQHYQTTSDPYF